jgi:aminopeptidase N
MKKNTTVASYFSLWLKEGFATYFSFYALDILGADENPWDHFIWKSVLQALEEGEMELTTFSLRFTVFSRSETIVMILVLPKKLAQNGAFCFRVLLVHAKIG